MSTSTTAHDTETLETGSDHVTATREETDSLGVVQVPADKLWRSRAC